MEKPKRYVNSETDCINLYESHILSMTNNTHNNQLIFSVDWLEGDPIRIECENVTDLMIKLKHNSSFENNAIGVMEITGFSYKKDADGFTVQFNFDFNLIGYIRFKCTQFAFVATSAPIEAGGNDYRI